MKKGEKGEIRERKSRINYKKMTKKRITEKRGKGWNEGRKSRTNFEENNKRE